jgi:hypothetical protein
VAEQSSLVHIPGRQVRQRATALVLMLDPHHGGLARRQSGMAAAARLNRGLLVGADDVLARAQRRTGEAALVQVQHDPGLGGKVGVAGIDPRAVLPRLDRVLVQPAPQRRGGHLADQPAGQQLGAQLAGDRLGVGDHPCSAWTRSARPRRPEPRPGSARPTPSSETSTATRPVRRWTRTPTHQLPTAAAARRHELADPPNRKATRSQPTFHGVEPVNPEGLDLPQRSPGWTAHRQGLGKPV